MKRICLILAAAFMVSAPFNIVRGQAYMDNPNYGASPEERYNNAMTLGFFNEQYNSKDYDQALKNFYALAKAAPRISQNIYIYSANIYKAKLLQSDGQRRQGLVDSLMMVYDIRAEAFGNLGPQRGKGYILSLKARDYYHFKPSDHQTTIRFFEEAVQEWKNDADPDFLNVFYKIVTEYYKAGKVDADMVIGQYEKLSPLFNIDQSAERVEARKTFDALLASSGVAGCENLEKVFKQKLEADPNDKTAIESAFVLMSRARCNSDFYVSVAEKYYAINPSSKVALALGSAFEERKMYSRALKYLGEAAENESDATDKANLYVRVAASELGVGNPRGAAEAARRAMSCNPENGYAYMIMAQAYAAGSNSACSGFERQATYWLIVDILSQARTRLADDQAMAANIDKQIATYVNGFPSKEECFFRGLSAGMSYAVNCGWISGRTTIR